MTTTLPLADTRDMIGLHQVFRDALAAAPVLVSGCPVGDTARAEVVGTYYDNVLRLLHGHHEGEDELMTPRLLARCTPAEADDVSRIASMHQDVTEELAAAEAAVTAWRRTASAADRDAAASGLGNLAGTLAEHLDAEEQVVLPIAAKYLNVAEWGELPAHGMRTFTGDKLWLIIGLVQQQMPAAARADMEAHMPPPVASMWNSPGRRMFTDFMTQLHGPAAG